MPPDIQNEYGQRIMYDDLYRRIQSLKKAVKGDVNHNTLTVKVAGSDDVVFEANGADTSGNPSNKTVTLPYASTDTAGIFKLGENLTMNNGVLSAEATINVKYGTDPPDDSEGVSGDIYIIGGTTRSSGVRTFVTCGALDSPDEPEGGDVWIDLTEIDGA